MRSGRSSRPLLASASARPVGYASRVPCVRCVVTLIAASRLASARRPGGTVAFGVACVVVCTATGTCCPRWQTQVRVTPSTLATSRTTCRSGTTSAGRRSRSQKHASSCSSAASCARTWFAQTSTPRWPASTLDACSFPMPMPTVFGGGSRRGCGATPNRQLQTRSTCCSQAVPTTGSRRRRCCTHPR